MLHQLIEYTTDTLAELQVPWRVTLGNHDDREAFLRAFPALADEHGFIQNVTNLGDHCVILLDSLQSGDVAGNLCSMRLQWLEGQLRRAQDKAVLLFLHHSPMRCINAVYVMATFGIFPRVMCTVLPVVTGAASPLLRCVAPTISLHCVLSPVLTSARKRRSTLFSG
ncbi:hypothetical protein [Candidatus Symbiopectobacterium sp.]|uniref:hypothetical protein n=1 Tax=Candidatus Symbiopectobacterium sp. TaxID=2816440 RepID=UPI0025BFB20B|nr:hypothetical protein [Candidatus Symbiopectobacterium sp.]